MQLVQRSNAIKYLQDKGIIGKEYTYAKRDDKKDVYALDPQLAKTLDDWTIVLNDIVGYRFVVIEIPKDSLTQDDLLKFKKRKDDPNKLSMRIEGTGYVEKRSGFDFSKYVTHIISYE